MKKSKTPKPTTKKKPNPKKELQFEVYDIFTGRQKPISEDSIKNLGLKFIKHCMELSEMKNPPSTRAEDFFRREGYYRGDIYRWSNRVPLFKQMYEEGLDILACIRANRVDENKMNWASVKYYMHNFGERWAKSDEYWSKINNPEEKKQDIAVYIDSIRTDQPKGERNE